MDPVTEPGIFLVIFLGWVIGEVIGIVAHEAGHALMATATGIHVRKVVIGQGKRLFRCDCRGIRIEANRIPIGGYTLIFPEVYLRKGAMLLMLLGGIIANFLLLIGAAVAWYSGLLPSWSTDLALGFICAQIFLILVALIPDAPSGQPGRSTDGQKIAHILKQENGSLTPLAKSHLDALESYSDGEEPITALSPASYRLMEFHHSLQHSANEPSVRREILQNLIAELEKGEMSRAEELMIFDTLITEAVVNANADMRKSMDEWSSRAVALDPPVPTLRFSRAAVLIELGRFAEGKAIIDAATRTEDRPFDTLLNNIFLAKAEAALGNHGRAEQLLARANKRLKQDVPVSHQAEIQELWTRTRNAIPQPEATLV